MAFNLHLSQIFISALLTRVMLLQVRGTGTGLFAQGQATYRTRRGLERTLFQFTIGLVALFVIVSILSVRLA